ncbi:MAG: hypothetical protein C5B59_02565 [Bacteroidetes bacterium]|nr:MAG: hypothetical protein C5B59_02565 [Bacteroidota bacterium]
MSFSKPFHISVEESISLQLTMQSISLAEKILTKLSFLIACRIWAQPAWLSLFISAINILPSSNS